MKIKKIFLYGTLGTLNFNPSFIYNITIDIIFTIDIIYLQIDGQKAWLTTRRPVSQMDDDLSASDTLPLPPVREPSIDFSFMLVPRHGVFKSPVIKNRLQFHK